MMGQPLVVMTMPRSGLSPFWINPALRLLHDDSDRRLVGAVHVAELLGNACEIRRDRTESGERGVEWTVGALFELEVRPIGHNRFLRPDKGKGLRIELNDELFLEAAV